VNRDNNTTSLFQNLIHPTLLIGWCLRSFEGWRVRNAAISVPAINKGNYSKVNNSSRLVLPYRLPSCRYLTLGWKHLLYIHFCMRHLAYLAASTHDT
jgi:hypothetical protein